MSKKLEDIAKHWQEAGRDFPTDSAITPTSRDPYLGMLEEENILSFLSVGRSVLEVGCGDASHTMKYAERAHHLVGFDVSSTLLEVAEKRMIAARLQNVEFVQGSVHELNRVLAERNFDCAISQRCLINLPDWQHQQEALAQIAELLCPGGLLLLSEGFQDELDELNRARVAVGLTAIQVAEYNHNFRKGEFEAFISQHFEIIATQHYGVYLWLSRVFHPLAVRPENPQHDSPLNRAAYEAAKALDLPDTDRYSYNRFYVLMKK